MSKFIFHTETTTIDVSNSFVNLCIEKKKFSVAPGSGTVPCKGFVDWVQ